MRIVVSKTLGNIKTTRLLLCLVHKTLVSHPMNIDARPKVPYSPLLKTAHISQTLQASA